MSDDTPALTNEMMDENLERASLAISPTGESDPPGAGSTGLRGTPVTQSSPAASEDLERAAISTPEGPAMPADGDASSEGSEPVSARVPGMSGSPPSLTGSFASVNGNG